MTFLIILSKLVLNNKLQALQNIRTNTKQHKNVTHYYAIGSCQGSLSLRICPSFEIFQICSSFKVLSLQHRRNFDAPLVPASKEESGNEESETP
jgi:hypothetical protein